MTNCLLNQWRCRSLRPIWPPGMDKLITLQQLLRNYLKLNVNYVFALIDFTISVTSVNDALFLNLITRCIYRQQHEQTCPIITIFLIVTKRQQTMSSPIVNILHHSYITNRKMFLRNICRWKDVVWKSRLAFPTTIVQGHNTWNHSSDVLVLQRRPTYCDDKKQRCHSFTVTIVMWPCSSDTNTAFWFR